MLSPNTLLQIEWRQVVEWADRLLEALDYIHTQYPPVIAVSCKALPFGAPPFSLRAEWA